MAELVSRKMSSADLEIQQARKEVIAAAHIFDPKKIVAPSDLVGPGPKLKLFNPQPYSREEIVELASDPEHSITFYTPKGSSSSEE